MPLSYQNMSKETTSKKGGHLNELLGLHHERM